MLYASGEAWVVDCNTCTCNEGQVSCTTQVCPECVTDADCADETLCNGQETCVDGACQSGPKPCPTGNQCVGYVGCDPNTGACEQYDGPDCDDDDPCTSDSCDPDMTCWAGVATDCPCVFTPIEGCQ